MDNSYKERLIGSGLLKKVPSKRCEYRANCPYCMDKHRHLYLYIDLDSNDPVKYRCFRCPNVRGILNEKLLLDMGFDEGAIKIPKGIKSMKRIKVDDSVSSKLNIITVNDDDNIDDISQYIQYRVGHTPTIDELRMFQYLGDPYRYVKDYLGDSKIEMLKNRLWFKLVNGNIAGRVVEDNMSKYRWMNYISTRVKTSGIYQMKTPVDMYQDINVIIAEGIMDVIGLYYNYSDLKNTSYVAVLGKGYHRGMEQLINKGVFGDSVNIHIFKDPNVPCENIWIDPITRQLFKKVFIYENTKGYDYGVKPDKLNIRRIEKR